MLFIFYIKQKHTMLLTKIPIHKYTLYTYTYGKDIIKIKHRNT